jgi:hypothetical protein
MFRLRRTELLLTAAFAACVAFQLFVPPSIGLANNGDFGKLIGRFAMGPASGDFSDEYRYFTSHWIYDQKYYWLADERSSELLPINIALFIGWEFGRANFDIRILGALHAILWIGCFAAMVPLFRSLSGWKWLAAALVTLFVLTDVSYVAYCNTFYRDAATFLFMSWAIVLWLHLLARDGPSANLFALFCAAAVLCVTSKAQHAPLGIFLLILAVVAALSFQGVHRKIGALILSLLIPPMAWITFFQVVDAEKLGQVYAVIFTKILHHSPAPVEEARELGLGPEYLRFVDYWPPQESDHPLKNPEWAEEFSRRTGQGGIARFYLHHPWRALTILYRDLHGQAAGRRPSGLGNYEKESGYPPFAQTNSFGWWSFLRSALFRIAPWHILVWYVVFLAMAIRAIWFDRKIAVLAVVLAAMGLTELAIATLGDAGETDRHLFLFHVITDLTMLLGLAFALHRKGQGSASLRTSS